MPNQMSHGQAGAFKCRPCCGASQMPTLMHSAFVPLSPRCSPILHASEARAGSCRANALVALQQTVGKAFETDAPDSFLFALIRKSATSTGPLGGFSDLQGWPFRRSEKAPPEIEKTGRASALPFSGPSRAGIVFDAGKSKARRYRAYLHFRIRLRVRPKFPPLRRA